MCACVHVCACVVEGGVVCLVEGGHCPGMCVRVVCVVWRGGVIVRVCVCVCVC